MLNGINLLIITAAKNNVSNIIYTLFHVLNYVVALIYTIWYGYKSKLGIKKTFTILVLAFPLIYLWMLVLYWIASGFKTFGGQNMVMVFVYVPIIALGVSKIAKVDWTEECCYHAASLPLLHSFGHLGCIFAGCCGGYVSTWGIYNVSTGAMHFPIQLIESIVSLSVALILIVRIYRRNFIPDEKQFPIMLVLYGSTRFMCEFFRDNKKILFGLSSLSLHALFMCLVGVVWLLVVKYKERELSEKCEK